MKCVQSALSCYSRLSVKGDVGEATIQEFEELVTKQKCGRTADPNILQAKEY